MCSNLGHARLLRLIMSNITVSRIVYYNTLFAVLKCYTRTFHRYKFGLSHAQ